MSRPRPPRSKFPCRALKREHIGWLTQRYDRWYKWEKRKKWLRGLSVDITKDLMIDALKGSRRLWPFALALVTGGGVHTYHVTKTVENPACQAASPAPHQAERPEAHK